MATVTLGNSYRFKDYNNNKYLNILTDGTPTNNSNVTIYSLDSSDMAQVWQCVDYSALGVSGALMKSVKNPNVALDRWRGSSNYNNADVYAIGTTAADLQDQLVEFILLSNGYYRIKLAYYDLYLTVSSTTTYGGYNVNWQALTGNTNQLWAAELYSTTGRVAVKVTNMPSGAGYDSQNLTETFHPDSGMIAGTWAANNGATIESQIASFYTKVYGVAPASKLKYLYSLYGGKYISGKYVGQYHPGVDINLYHGATIYPSRSGTVVDKGTFYVTVQSGNEYLIYVHLNPSSSIGVNSPVIAGETPLGTQSCLGLGLSAEEIANGEDSHLHIEVHKVSTGNKVPQLPTPTVEDHMTITTPPYSYLN